MDSPSCIRFLFCFRIQHTLTRTVLSEKIGLFLLFLFLEKTYSNQNTLKSQTNSNEITINAVIFLFCHLTRKSQANIKEIANKKQSNSKQGENLSDKNRTQP